MRLLVIAAYGVVNLAAYAAFGWDKSCAIQGRRRVPESNLLALALFGGALGALIGQQRFRHKTRKQPFRAILIGMALLNVLVAVVLLGDDTRAALMAALS